MIAYSKFGDYTEPTGYPERTVAIINDGYTVITVDDSCYVIMNWIGFEATWHNSSYIIKEALDKLKELPDNPNDAKDIEF